MIPSDDYVKCGNCSWVHLAVPREWAEKQVMLFNKFFKTLSKDKQEEFYGGTGATLKEYENCHRCGGSYKNFSVAEEADIPNGSTVSSIIKKDE